MNHHQSQQKTYILEGLGCANCAAKMEQKIQQLPGIDEASLAFATRQLKISASDPAALKDEIQQICQSIEDGVTLIEKTSTKEADRRGNGMNPDADCSKAFPDNTVKTSSKSLSRHKVEIVGIVIGTILFIGGLVFGHIDDIIMVPVIPFLFFVAAYILLGNQVLLTAARNISRGQIFDETFLMSLATIAAFCIGEFAEGVGVMLFYRIGELFEHIAVERSRSQIMNAVDMRPETVTLAAERTKDDDDFCQHEHNTLCECEHDRDYEHDHHEHQETDSSLRIIPAEDAKPGDILLVRPGDRIPLDGVVTEGHSRIDTSPVTGEPVPVSAGPGTTVISGCLNERGVLKIRVTHPLSESMVTRILDSVENAAAGKPKIDKFITRFARIYTPIVVVLAVLTAVIPSVITGEWVTWIKTAITFLVISCPCALVISVPLAFFAGIGAASRLGILFKDGLTMEALKNLKGIVMDKTGTITKGIFAVDHISSFGDLSENELLSLASSCEAASTHPVAISITEAAEARGLSTIKPSSLEEFAGMGVLAKFKDTTHYSVLCGNRKLMEKYDVWLPEALKFQKPSGLQMQPELPEVSASPELSALLDTTGTEVLIAVDGTLIGRIMISDQLKEDSAEAVTELKSMRLVPAMLTGDNMESGAAIADSLGISRIRAGLLPEDKVAALEQLRGELGPVMFVGDGINDAPVLAGADVGAAMGSGTDSAIEAADVVFMTSSLSAISQAISIARRVGRIATQNIVFALGIKLLVILLGLAGFANIWAAVFSDTGVAMLCILNSLRILMRRSDRS